MKILIPFLTAAILILAECIYAAPTESKSPPASVSLRLTLSAETGQVVIVNGTTQSWQLYRDRLILSVSGKTKDIPMFPKPPAPEKPIELKPGGTLTWKIIVTGNQLYPYSVARGGIRLLEKEHKVKAIYLHSDTVKLESNEVTYKME